MGIDSALTASDASGFLACDTRGGLIEKILNSEQSLGNYLRYILMGWMAMVFLRYHVILKCDATGLGQVLKSLILT